VSYNLKVAGNAVPMFMRPDRMIDWWNRDAWPKAGMGTAAILMRDSVSRNDT